MNTERISALCADYPTPFYLFDIHVLQQRIQTLRARLSEESAPDPAAAAGHPAKQPSRGAQAHAPSPMQVGNYARPQKEPEEPEGSNFISFFEKKDEE